MARKATAPKQPPAPARKITCQFRLSVEQIAKLDRLAARPDGRQLPRTWIIEELIDKAPEPRRK